MSVGRDVIAKVLKIPEERIRCDRCLCADRWINDAIICKAWQVMTGASDFCSLFVEQEDGE